MPWTPTRLASAQKAFLGIMMVRCYCCVTLEETQLPHRIPIHVHTAYDYRYHRGLTPVTPSDKPTRPQYNSFFITQPISHSQLSHMHRPRARPPLLPHVCKPKTRGAVKYVSKVKLITGHDSSHPTRNAQKPPRSHLL